MILDDLMAQDLKEYILQTTQPETQLLKNVREYTLSKSAVPQMLSGPVEGKFLNLLVKISGAKNCLELGTFTGYSGLHIAEALPVDGKLVTCENNPTHAEIAQKFFDQSPYAHKIEIRVAPALETIKTLKGPLDFIFIDADKVNYPAYYDALVPLLKKGGLMVIDNALWGGEVVKPDDKYGRAIDELNQKARNDSRVEKVMLSIRDGILMLYKRDQQLNPSL